MDIKQVIKNSFSGKIVKLYALACGSCDLVQFSFNDNRAYTKDAAREWGWIETELDGWICPNCQKRRELPKAAK